MGDEGEWLPDGFDDNILSEILLRLPPPPSSLPRASAVCRRWHSLIHNPGFRRRFRRHHRRSPPLLGFFDPEKFVPTLHAPNLVPPGRFSIPAADDNVVRYTSYGSRHGLVLLLVFLKNHDSRHLLVWDPASGDQHRVDIPPEFGHDARGRGAVLRDAAAGDDVHFQVVLVWRAVNEDGQRRAVARVYSSKTNSWGDLVSVPLPPEAYMTRMPMFVMEDPAVLVGDSLYWQLSSKIFSGILRFDLGRQSLDVIWVPVSSPFFCYTGDGFLPFSGCFSVIREEDDGGLGLFSVSGGFTAQLWKRETDSDGVASWVLGRTIQLDKLLSLDLDERGRISVKGYAEENNCVFLRTATGLFIVQLQSLHFTSMEVPETSYMPPYHPFESVFTAETHNNGPDEVDLSERGGCRTERDQQTLRSLGPRVASLFLRRASGSGAVASGGEGGAALAAGGARRCCWPLPRSCGWRGDGGWWSRHGGCLVGLRR